MKLLLLLIFLSSIVFSQPEQQLIKTVDSGVTVDINKTVNTKVNRLLGISFDSRTSFLSPQGPVGYYDADGKIIPAVDLIFKNFPLTGIRYPANGVMNGFDWKKSVGPLAARPSQKLFPASSILPQPVNFGFDEFMAMAVARGVDPKDVQIMVPIYDSQSEGLRATQLAGSIVNPAQYNADWVEYANAHNDGSNPGGGIDWAAVRSANGHPVPYGIEIWNMGNEPYTSNEYGINGVDSYINTIIPIIDAMRAIDPSIKISVTGPGKANGMWTNTLLNSVLLKGRIYAINSHFFMSEDVVGNTIPNGVAIVESYLSILASAAESRGYKIIVGDYAHGIPLTAGGQPSGDPDLAMQWKGAHLSADFLLMMSQIKNIERANFWVYGLTSATWHPIRLNADRTYTSLPAAEMYKILSPLFLDQSGGASNYSIPANDGNSYSVRASAFNSADRTKLNVIAVNRDKTNNHQFHVDGTGEYIILSAKLLTAAGETAEAIDEETIIPDANENYFLPPRSILIIQYDKKITGVTNNGLNHFSFELCQNYPNPFNPETVLNYQLSMSGHVSIKVYDVLGRNVATLIDEFKQPGIYRTNFNGRNFPSGIYFYRIQAEKFSATKKMLLLK